MSRTCRLRHVAARHKIYRAARHKNRVEFVSRETVSIYITHAARHKIYVERRKFLPRDTDFGRVAYILRRLRHT